MTQKCRAWHTTKNRLKSYRRGRKVQHLRADTQKCTVSNGTVARISCEFRTFQITQYFLSFLVPSKFSLFVTGLVKYYSIKAHVNGSRGQ